MQFSKDIGEYFKKIEEGVKRAYSIASEARKKGLDPEDKVDIPLANNMAERVEGLISTVAPQLINSGITKRIQQLEKKYGLLDWRVALVIAEEVAKEKFCKFNSKKEAIEVGIRTGFAYHTLGIVAAPLEGFIEVVIKKTKDGKEYLALKYAGPVRGAGGTGASVSVIIADYVRKKLGFSAYDPDDKEIERYVTELYDYHERVTNLQYKPSPDEIRFLIKHIPVEIDGDPTERIEVSNYKDLPRVDTNRIRGGVCLVISMIALKAPKLWKRLAKWGKEFELEWDFLSEFLTIQKKAKSKQEVGVEEKIKPDYTFISDLVAGRPVLTYPMQKGGFRLRYGRSRISGYSAASIHPATMYLLNKYIATGSQLKIERPGKAAAITPCDTIEGPIVKLKNGTVLRIETENQAKQLLNEIEEILFLGDLLISYGDFSENGHRLIPCGYNEEWWQQELEKAIVNNFGSIDLYKLSELVDIPSKYLEKVLNQPFDFVPTAEVAIKLSEKLNIPLHPRYTYHWADIDGEQFFRLIKWLDKAKVKKNEDKIDKIVIPVGEEKRILEEIGIPHSVVTNEFIIIDKNEALALLFSLGITKKEDITKIMNLAEENLDKNALEIIKATGINLRDKSGIYIGARMGRPEKAKMRKLTGSPQVLFPVGDEGGRLRAFQAALEEGKVRADFPLFFCQKCNRETIYSICEVCNSKTKRKYYCKFCGVIDRKKCRHGKAQTFKKQDIDIKHYFEFALKKIKETHYPDLIKGVRGTSNKDHIPERLEKGILRAKHKIYVNKDGTVRYDMTELPITHFKIKEISTSIEKLKELGYYYDIKGNEIRDRDQIVELKPQDIILPSSTLGLDESADNVLFRVANFIDEELVKLYDLKPFYNLKNKEDLIGQLVVGLAPHISAGMVGRIIGFSQTQALFAHPLWHAALRRDCDGDEACVMLLMDALLNFSRQYLPDKRGGRTMDAPLVLTCILNPAEVDDMVHGLDVCWRYPLEFYEAALEYKYPWDIDIEQLKKRLNTTLQYEKFGYTHDVSNINIGVLCSAYKTLPTMEEKLKGQMEVAEKIRAVSEKDVAALVIDKHFIKDIKGNLRKFSMQQFRCVKCNEKYRRPPLAGKCYKCGGRIIFTISKGSIIKYLDPALSLAEKYDVPSYLKHTLELTKRRIESVFGKEKERQEGLGKWFA